MSKMAHPAKSLSQRNVYGGDAQSNIQADDDPEAGRVSAGCKESKVKGGRSSPPIRDDDDISDEDPEDRYDDQSESKHCNNNVNSFDELTLRQVLVRKHIHTASLFIVAVTAAGFLLTHLRPVLLPFIQAMMLTYTLTPMIDILTARTRPQGGFRMTAPEGVEYRATTSNGTVLVVRRPRATSINGDGTSWKNLVLHNLKVCASIRLPRGLAIVVALIIAAMVTSGVGAIVASSVTDLSQNADKYRERVQQAVDFAMVWTRLLNIDWQSATNNVMSDHFVYPVSELFFKTLAIIFDELSNGFLMLLFTVYLLLGYKPHKQRSGIRAEIDRQVKRYIGCKVLLAASSGTIVGIILTLLNVDLALVFGLMTFVLNFIPNIGSLISSLLPMPVVLFDPSKTWLDMVLAFCLPGAVQMIMGNVIEPRVFGKTMELHPISVLLALMLWGSLWGVVGMILSVPMTAVLKICLNSLDHPMTKFCARLMEGKVDQESIVLTPQMRAMPTPVFMASGAQMPHTPLSQMGSGHGDEEDPLMMA